jgi:hypothetical protein
MGIKNLIKFEPVDITHIVITIGIVLIIVYSFKSQLNGFFETLQDRPITVKMSGSETTIELDAPVKPELLTEAIANPQITQQQIHNWEQEVEHINSIEMFQKLGFNDLYRKLKFLKKGQLAVLNYEVDNPNKNYFNDKSMLKYLSIASEKVRYLAFYKNNNFEGAIEIEAVISGLSSGSEKFRNFGDKIKSEQWIDFPGLIRQETSFRTTPSVKELYEFLTTQGLDEVALVEEGKLIGFLNYKSISKELYSQAAGG